MESAPDGGARFWFEAAFKVSAPPSSRGDLGGLRVSVETASPIVREAAGRQLEASGAYLSASGDCEVRLADAAVDMAAVGPGEPPTLVLLAPEDRSRIEGLRALGYAGYLIKPLRRVSVVERVRAVAPSIAAAGPRDGLSPDERAKPSACAVGLKVLLAEDNPVNALLARALLNRAGCTVERAGGGEEAVAAALSQPYDLILMDMRMPGMSGLDAARAIRAAGCKAPMVALTANAFDDDRRACREAGMDGFLTKPLDPMQLEAILVGLGHMPQELGEPR